jgi:hypothetical protein
MKNNLLDRPVLRDIVKAVELGKVVFLLGSRQVGKTSLMKLAIDHFSGVGYRCFYLDMDDMRNVPVFESIDNLENYLVAQRAAPKSDKILIGVDEFYAVGDVVKIFKLISDHYKNIRIMASGSSAVEAKASIEESLAGRVRVIEVFPLSFEESLLFKQNPYLENLKQKNFQADDFIIANVKNELEDMLIYGGYPRINLLTVDTDKIEEIYDIYSTYVQKDVRALLDDEDVIKFNKLVKLLAAQSGQLLNIAAIANALMLSRKTVEKYLFVLEKTYIICLLQPYESNVKKTIVKTPKVFFVDNGMMNMAIENFSAIELRQNRGSVFENFILAEILKHKKKYQSLYFYRTMSGTEIDFILQDAKRGILPIEVKYKDMEKPVIPRGVLEFARSEKVQEAYIINKNLYHRQELDNTTFIFLPYVSIKNITS